LLFLHYTYTHTVIVSATQFNSAIQLCYVHHYDNF